MTVRITSAGDAAPRIPFCTEIVAARGSIDFCCEGRAGLLPDEEQRRFGMRAINQREDREAADRQRFLRGR